MKVSALFIPLLMMSFAAGIAHADDQQIPLSDGVQMTTKNIDSMNAQVKGSNENLQQMKPGFDAAAQSEEPGIRAVIQQIIKGDGPYKKTTVAERRTTLKEIMDLLPPNDAQTRDLINQAFFHWDHNAATSK